MHNIYNSVLETYQRSFYDLPDRQRFHFANRLYLWGQWPQAADWLTEMRSTFTADEQPLQTLIPILTQALPELAQTGALRQPFFERYPLLRSYERVLFRILFLHSVYGIDGHALLFQVLDEASARQLYDSLLHDPEALRVLSSYAINYLYLFDHFDTSVDRLRLQPEQLLKIADGYTGGSALDRQLEDYYYTHCILGETLLYARPVATEKQPPHLKMLQKLETIITEHLVETKLDVLYEYLVCCRILNHRSELEPQILARTEKAVHPDGFIAEPLSTHLQASLQNAEHRNVLFLLSQSPYRPLAKI